MTLTPGSTWQDMITALQAEVGDTVTFHLRPIGAPPVTLVTYISSLSHEIDIRTGWNTTYQLSPAATQAILACDSPTTGCLTGAFLIGW